MKNALEQLPLRGAGALFERGGPRRMNDIIPAYASAVIAVKRPETDAPHTQHVDAA